jgi:hypothetical protein
MNKCKSYPHLSEKIIQPLRKSSSLCDLNESDYYFEEFFEGDGPLGIIFASVEGDVIVKKIISKTVGDETFGLQINMKLINVNNKDIERKSYEKVMEMINKSWKTRSSVYLKFRKIIIPEISKILNQNNLLKYYDQFIELGASILEDFNFVEHTDLIKMGMNNIDIKNFKNINPNI